MPITLNYAPSSQAVATAGYQAGYGDYNRWLSGMQLQQRQLDQQKLLAQQQMQTSMWQTKYSAASDQYMQQQGINNQQMMQLRDLTNSNYQQQAGFAQQSNMQARDLTNANWQLGQNIGSQQTMQLRGLANDQYLQQSSLANQRLMQMNQITSDLYQQQSHQSFAATQAAYSRQADLQSQVMAGQMQSALSSQQYNQNLGLGSQHFDQLAQLEQMQTDSRMAINRSNLQDQLDFIPQMSEAEYAAQQKQFASKFNALQGALNEGTISQDQFNSAQSELLGNQLGLKRQMPTRTDFANQFASNVYTDTSMPVPGVTNPDGTPMMMRYIRNPHTGQIELDPAMQSMIENSRYNAATRSKANQTTANFISSFQSNVTKMASEMVKGDITGNTTWEIALQDALDYMMQIGQHGLNGAAASQ